MSKIGTMLLTTILGTAVSFGAISNYTEPPKQTREYIHVDQSVQKLEYTNLEVLYKNRTMQVEDYFGSAPGTTLQFDLIQANTIEYDVLPVWDYKLKGNSLAKAYAIFTEGYGLSPELACGIIGNMAMEGDFGIIAGRGCNTVDDAISNTYGGAYGMVQWATGRKSTVRKYLNYFKENYSDEYDEMDLVAYAECTAVYYDMIDLGLYDYLSNCESIEGCTGYFAVKYEAYTGSAGQWKWSNGQFYCKSSGSNGGKRLEYAQHCYEEFYLNAKDNHVEFNSTADNYTDYIEDLSGSRCTVNCESYRVNDEQ